MWWLGHFPWCHTTEYSWAFLPEVKSFLFLSRWQLLNLTNLDFASEVCDGSHLGTLFLFNSSSGLTEDEISEQLCAVDKDTAIEVGDYLIKEMDIGTLIENVSRNILFTTVAPPPASPHIKMWLFPLQLLSFSPAAMLERANVSSEELKSLMSNFERLQADLSEMLSGLSNTSLHLNVDSLTSPNSQKQKGRGWNDQTASVVSGHWIWYFSLQLLLHSILSANSFVDGHLLLRLMILMASWRALTELTPDGKSEAQRMTQFLNMICWRCLTLRVCGLNTRFLL